MAEDTRAKFRIKKIHRGSQVVFGERAHLLEVLHSVQRAPLPRARKLAETRQLQRMIAVRTEDLNRFSPAWDRKFQQARNSQTTSQKLLRIGAALHADDYLLARLLAEHAEAPPELLEHLASHPYAAVRENVARHPHTPAAILRAMAEDAAEPLWFLVACNPSTPADLRDRLRERMKQSPNS
ncbi:MAG: hypothetical protein ABSF45_16415 [Terriglobia bacterium]|jgi:hypothetical protein